ncbi:MAG: carbohydrate ABC transporter permease [Acidimicrobiales bacterium]
MATGRTGRATPSAPPYRRRAVRPSWRRSLRRQLLPICLLLPALGLIGLMTGYPLGRLFATSFQNLGLFQLFSHQVVWNGFSNYRTLFSSSDLGTSVLQSVVFVAVCVGLTMLIGTGVALLLGRIGKALGIIVTVCMLFAWAMPTSAAAIVWTWLFETEWGVVNYILSGLGFHFANHDWFANGLSAYSIITANIVWGAVPFVAITMYSALTLVPRDLLEAAAVDGASAVTTFRQVTLPIVRPIFVLLTVLSVIWDANVFNQVWYLTQGDAQRLNVIPLGVWQYIEAFSSQQYGLGAATAVIMILLLVAVTGYYIRIMVRTGEVSGKVKA